MNPKRILIVGTMALTITIGGGIWSKETNASVPLSPPENSDSRNVHIAAKDEFLQALGATSDEEIYDSLLQGKSLADIADANHESVQNIIHLQIAELTKLLDKRLADGTLPPEVHQAQKAELADIITKSVYGERNA